MDPVISGLLRNTAQQRPKTKLARRQSPMPAVFEKEPKTLPPHVPQQPTHLVPSAPLHDTFDDCVLEICITIEPLEIVLPE